MWPKRSTTLATLTRISAILVENSSTLADFGHISHINRKTRRRDINKRKKLYFSYNLYLFDITMVMTKINDQNMVIFTNKCHFLNYENKESF
jgi:hypothetical protein